MTGDSTPGATEGEKTRVLGASESSADITMLEPAPPDGPALNSRSSASVAMPSSSRQLGVPAPETVLRRSEIDQTRKTATAGVLFSLLALALIGAFGGDPFAKEVCRYGLALAVLNNAWLLYGSSSPQRYSDRRAIIYFLVAPVHNTAILYYAGLFGVVQVMFVLNIYTACVAYRKNVARVVLVVSILPTVALGGAMSMGWISDPGIISLGPYVGRVETAILVLAIVGFLLATYQQANRSRELLVASLVERDGAVRVASHREALLVEARNELEQALHAGGFGRFTDQTLGSFKLGAIIGRGGMGEVYEAVHVETGDPAAVKMLLPSVLGRPGYVRRFLREVGIASSLDSPNVVKVLEIGDESAGMPYLAMERLVGKTLADLLRERGRLETRAVSDLLRQVADGLRAAAAAGIVHRDLKPQNLFLTRDEPGTWKILDFGISKLAGGSDTLTHGEALGTPQYMAPEQARGEAVDLRTDLYALGAIAYRALTGYRPFGGNESAAVLVRVLKSAPKRPSSCVDLPADIDRFLAIAMAKDPADRFQTTSELVEAFDTSAAERLDPADRARADKLVRALPWGH